MMHNRRKPNAQTPIRQRRELSRLTKHLVIKTSGSEYGRQADLINVR